MSLYGRTDSTDNQTKAGIGVVSDSNTKTIVFIDQTEAQLEENKSRGLNSPGWWAYDTYTDMHGNTRHKAELMVSVADPEANADETLADDTYAADVTSVITISAQPTNQTAVAGGATFSVTASSTGAGATLTYQWQKLDVAGTEWANVSGATSASLVLAGLVAGDSGDKYRVKINNSIGGVEVTSNSATLTV